MSAGGIEAQLERRRRLAAERWNLNEGVVLIGPGAPVPVPGRGDRTYPFRSHSEYLYLTDRERPGGVLGFGGIRIENNALITDGEPEVMTADIPILA